MPLAHEGEWGSAEAMRLDDKSMPPRARASEEYYGDPKIVTPYAPAHEGERRSSACRIAVCAPYSPPRARANGIGLFHKSARLHIPPRARGRTDAMEYELMHGAQLSPHARANEFTPF